MERPALYIFNIADLDLLVKKQENLMERENWTCKFCGKLETDVSLFANHILEHYNAKVSKRYSCDLCAESFTIQKKLKRHLKTKHKKDLPTLSNNPKATEILPDKTGNKDLSVGDPLLNVVLNDSLDNTNLVMPTIELNQIGVMSGGSLESQNLLLESDSLNLSVDNLLTENVKELDHFNFEIGESQEQYVCDVCLKSFSKLYYLTQHLKKHTGRYTCHYCLKVFCRRENLDSHNCSKLKTPQFNCSLCDRSFMLKKYLVRHVNTIHIKKHTCENCNKQYHSNKEYLEHNCLAVPDSCKPTFTCVTCNKRFFREVYLKKHMKIHEHHKQTLRLPTRHLICEICAQPFSTKKGLQTHKQTHTEPTLECEICNKKFHRQEVLNAHKVAHDQNQVTCSVCNVKLKSKQNLTTHMMQHTGAKSHKCEFCSKTYYQRSNLTSHIRKTHSKTCHICSKTFTTLELFERHKACHLLQEYYECPFCDKVVKLRYSLKKHLKNIHPEEKVSDVMLKIKPKLNSNLSKDGSMELEDNIGMNNNNDENNEVMNINIDNINNMTFGNDENNVQTNGVSNNIGEQISQNYINNKVSNEDINMSIHNLENLTSETEQDNLETIVSNLESMMNSYNSNDASNLLLNGNDRMEGHQNQERILDFNDFEIDLDGNFDLQENQTVNNATVSLSMPDLLDTTEEIPSSENAFGLADGGGDDSKEGQKNIIYYIVK